MREYRPSYEEAEIGLGWEGFFTQRAQYFLNKEYSVPCTGLHIMI